MLKRSILLVDDNKAFTEVFTDYFKSYNESDYEIIGVANNGIEAIAKITSLMPDIVLLDISMPQYSGYHVLENLNIMQLDKKPQVVMLTGMSMHDTIQSTLKLGAVGYIEKPFEMERVMSVLSRI